MKFYYRCRLTIREQQANQVRILNLKWTGQEELKTFVCIKKKANVCDFRSEKIIAFLVD